MQMHPDQLPVSLVTVRELVDQQFPQWQELPVAEVASHATWPSSSATEPDTPRS